MWRIVTRRTKAHGDAMDGAAGVGIAPAGAPFSMFPDGVAAELRRRAVHRCWSDGTVVLPRGHVVPWVMTLVRGRLRMAATFEDGHEVFFRWHVPGEMVGLISGVGDLPLPVDAVAFDDCETLHLEREALLQMMLDDGQVALAVARIVARHAYDVVDLVKVRHEPTLNARVLGVLRHLALVNGRPHGPAAWSLAVSQHDVASAVGASRQRVNAELRALEDAGHIQLGYRRVIVVGHSWPATTMLVPDRR